ncbi:hypothetical protein IKZ77_01225, partial [Candidatus Saccharibacteria bacterium]|nr:hypothetical protein [Candidatus Saccharibacteria bacterium]
MKRSCMQFLGVVCILCGLSLVSNANALTYQDGSDIQFTFNSTLSISLSDADIVIGNLIPGQDDTSNAVDVVVNTNNIYGYTLTATVGSAAKDYRDLRHTNGTANFASIDVNSDLSTLSGESSSVWGYTASTNGTTWSNYNGLPKYDDTTNTAELNVTDGAAEDSTTSFKIGAYAAEGQLAGDYTNVINFVVVVNGPPATTIATATYMQDVSSKSDGGCPTELPTNTAFQLTDLRDGEVYNIAKLADGNCWLLDNLRLDLTTTRNLTTTNTNITADWTAPTDIETWSATYNAPKINASSKNTVDTGGFDAGKYGVYYNFCAATAGTYCLTDDASPESATQDICPFGWRLPTGGSSG